MLNFLKKKELAEIDQLKIQISDLNSTLLNLKQELDKFSTIKDLYQQQIFVLNEIKSSKSELDDLKSKYGTDLSLYKKLKHEVSIYETSLDIKEYGIYEPIYDFEKSDDYRNEQNQIVNQQKEMIKAGSAAVCATEWTINGSVTKGKASTNKFIKLILRAFNGEADAMLTKVKWNNINQILERLYKSYNTLNGLGASNTVTISQKYLDLKIKEIRLEYEFRIKKQEEKEQLRALQEEVREEEKARRELEKAQKDAEKEESYYQKILEKVKSDLEANIGNSDELQSKIATLEHELEVVRLKKERALSMAQQTKRGNVYVISNVGSFGENVYKIGMTRRLDPMDRVRELGDASVPFKFDLHALIYSDEARTLEYELHKAFADRAINLLNYRKEFFQVTLKEIQEKVKELGFDAEFSEIPEAMEYRESIVIKESKNYTLLVEDLLQEPEFPNELL